MAYDAPLPRLRAITGSAAPAHGVTAPRLCLTSRNWRELDQREAIAAWDRLAETASEPNPFYESWYLLPSLKELDAAGDVRLLTFEADGELAGLIPLRLALGYYGHPLPHVANWVHPNCFLGLPLVARGLEREFWRSLLAWCDGRTRLPLFLHLADLPHEGPVRDALVSVLEDEARPAQRVFRQSRAMLRSGETAKTYFEASVSAKKRKELRRQQRRLEDAGEFTVERRSDYGQIAEWTREFLSLEEGGWKGDAGSAMASSAETRAIFQHAIAGAAARGRLERLALRLDGQPVAMLATFLTGSGAYSYKTAFDERFARFSPGVLLQRENLALLDREEIAWVDSCAAQDHPMIDHIWRERRVVDRLSIGIGGPLRRAAFSALIRFETGHGARGIA